MAKLLRLVNYYELLQFIQPKTLCLFQYRNVVDNFQWFGGTIFRNPSETPNVGMGHCGYNGFLSPYLAMVKHGLTVHLFGVGPSHSKNNAQSYGVLHTSRVKTLQVSQEFTGPKRPSPKSGMEQPIMSPTNQKLQVQSRKNEHMCER